MNADTKSEFPPEVQEALEFVDLILNLSPSVLAESEMLAMAHKQVQAAIIKMVPRCVEIVREHNAKYPDEALPLNEERLKELGFEV